MAKSNRLKCPAVSPTLLVTENAKAAAALSCRFGRNGRYFPILSAAHLEWEGGKSEAIQIVNCASRISAGTIITAGLSEEAQAHLRDANGSSRRKIIDLPCTDQAISAMFPDKIETVVRVSMADVGAGVLEALTSAGTIQFDDTARTPRTLASRSGHLVVCEPDDHLNMVIAANYAYALGANIKFIPGISRRHADRVIDQIHRSDEDRERSQSSIIEENRSLLRSICGEDVCLGATSVTFVGKVPYGFAFLELPSTHLPNYPYLGRAILNGFSFEQERRSGIRTACVIEPGQVPAPEIVEAAETLASRGALVRGVRGSAATARKIRQTIELLPYDLLIIATHCGDTSGWRRTYHLVDSEGRDRTMVVDVAATLDRPDADDLVHVVEFIAPLSVDGVGWNDPDRDEKISVGSVFKDLIDQIQNKKIEPSDVVEIKRVPLSSALAANDGNCLVFSRNIAGYGTPVIINNACSSWRRLSSNFMSAGCRSYIGTMFSINGIEAQVVLNGMLNKHHQKPLPIALWCAQRDAYKSDVRHPYVHEGVFTQYANVIDGENSQHLLDKIAPILAHLRKEQKNRSGRDPKEMKNIELDLEFCDFEHKMLSKHVNGKRIAKSG